MVSPCSLVIEELTEQDLPAVIQMDQECLGGLWTESGYRREIDSPNSQLLILKPASQTSSSLSLSSSPPALQCEPFAPPPTPNATTIIGIGCVWFILEEAHITILAIHPPYRRQGLGQFLLITLLETAIQRQSKWATLEVRLSNQSAQKLYEKLGFIALGKRKKYYQDTGEDALILWNKGLQNPSFHNDLKYLQQQTLARLKNTGWTIHLATDLNSPLCPPEGS